MSHGLVFLGSEGLPQAVKKHRFSDAPVERTCNRGIEKKLCVEREKLKPLPSARVPEYTTFRPTVRRWSTINVAGRIYSVPSRLKGHEVEVRQHADIVEVRYRGHLIETMPRLRGESEHRIDYRHVIWSLVRKPGAFAQYRYREDLFPTLVFRQAYDALRRFRGDRADVEYVRILHLAASTLQADVERALVDLLGHGHSFDYAAVKAIAAPQATTVPDVHVGEIDLTAYDALLVGGAS